VGFRLNGPFSSTAIQPGAWTISGNITSAANAGQVVWFGGNWNLHGNNTINGFTMDNNLAMILGVGHDNALGGAASTVTVTTFGGMLRADNGPRTLANPFVLNGAANNFGITGTNPLTLTGTFLLNSTGTTNHNINVINTATTTISGVISAVSPTAPMSKTGFGDLVLSGANTFAGGFDLRSGSLGFGSSGGVGSGPVGTGTFSIGNGANIRAVGAARTVSNPVTVNGDFVVDGTQVLTLSGAMSLGTLVRTVAVTNTANTFFSGPISGAGGSITKEGAGWLIINNPAGSTYTGGTTINNGRLLINNATGSALGTGAVVVNNGGRLGVLSTSEGGTGIGSFSGGLLVNSGGFVKAGNSVGLLTIGGGMTLNAGSTMEVDIDGFVTPGVDWSQIISSNPVTINNATLSVNASVFVPIGTILTIIRNDSNSPVAGIFAGLPEGAIISAGPNTFQITYIHNDPLSLGLPFNDVAFISVVPEPGTLALMFTGVLGAGGYWWRRRQKRLEAEVLPNAG
jgi:autotransporter-associated beta strand protein